MTTLSERLADLSDRSKRVEDALGAAREKNLEMLKGRRRALRSSVTRGTDRLESAGDEVAETLKAPWKHAYAAVEKSFAAAREEADERRVHKGLAKAERRADHAEEAAANAAALAVLVLDRTEYLVAEAVLARADAEDLLDHGDGRR